MRTPIALFLALFLALPAALAAAATSSAAPTAAGPCSSGQVAKTRSYVYALELGGAETMYTPAEARAMHPKSGEVMLGGRMAMADAMPGTRAYHLEVHVCTPAGKVVTGLRPTLTVVDPKAMSMGTTALPVAIMQGVGEGRSDYHYGNEIALTPGRRITVTFTVKGERAVFRVTVPKSA
jgi:hypothetical protein